MIFGREIERRSRYNRQLDLQPWVPQQPVCTEDVSIALPESSKWGEFYQEDVRPWKKTLGYHQDDTPLRRQYESMDPCYVPSGMITEPLQFPNLVTAHERDPAHAKRVALYTRYTPLEWTQSNLTNYSEADYIRNYSERLRNDFVKVMRETEEKTAQGQRESGRRLGERITDTVFWRNEVRTELQRMLTEINMLQNTRDALKKAMEDIETPLHIAQECLYQREKRKSIELVHDGPEQALLNEVEVYRRSRERLRKLYEKAQNQLKTNRASQHELETDVKSKESAMGIDNMCHQINNYTKGINYYAGIEKFDDTVSTVATWAENSNRIMQRALSERGKSAQLRSDADTLINACAQEIWDAWTLTNNALSRRASETLETKNKLQTHLHKVQQEIFDLEKHIELLKKSILDKSNPLKVAQTRLEARTHRRDIELCKDPPHERLIAEVRDLQTSIEALHKKMKNAQEQLQQLLKTRSRLESDLHNKCNSLFIDRDKCMGMRRSFPINAIVKY